MFECVDVDSNGQSLVEVVVLGENEFNPDSGPLIISENVQIQFEDLNKNNEQESTGDQNLPARKTPNNSDILVAEENTLNNNSPANVVKEKLSNISDSEAREEPTKEERKITIKSRKQKKQVEKWKCVERKRKRQAGKEYINSRKKKVPQREIKTKKDCTNKCKYNCAKKISQYERKHIFDSYYSVDQNRKYDFICKTTSRMVKGRTTTGEHNSRRNFTFKYSFFVNDEKLQVCKYFYLTTIDISQKVVYNVHQRKNSVTGLTQSDQKGKKGSRSIPEDQKQFVRDHIKSFPCVESHYCRARTSKTYLDPTLNITKMYDLYVKFCEEQSKMPVKESYYRFIFCSEFNLDFHVPKTDRCGICAAYETLVKDGNDINENMKENYSVHNKLKEIMREKKKEDKSSSTAVVIFDLQNVITSPKSEIGPLFYKCKLNIYNLTAYLTTTKTTYCAIWTENTSGRTGNDLACAFIKILNRIVSDNEIEAIITWSDSCVPQNRNSIMAFAILNFLKEHPDIQSFEMKYSVTGHSACQEVDTVHSIIEKHLKPNEFFSPLGLMRLLKTASRKKPFVILQMDQSDYRNFGDCSKKLDWKNVPFSKLHMMRCTQESFYEIQYSFGFNKNQYERVSIKPTERKSSRVQDGNNKKNSAHPLLEAPAAAAAVIQKSKILVKDEKRTHLISMFAYMSRQDLDYYRVILDIGDEEFEEIMKKINRESRLKKKIQEKVKEQNFKKLETKKNKATIIIKKKPVFKGPKLQSRL